MKISLTLSSLPAILLAVFLAAFSSQAAGQGPSCVLFGMLGAPCPLDNPGMGPPGSDDPPNSADVGVVSHAPVIWLMPPMGSEPLSAIQGASSTLHRNRHGITASMTTHGLQPESAYTLWWVVFNNPEHCASVPCSLDDLFDNVDVEGGLFGGSGQVTDAYGRAHFQVHAFKGEDPGLERPLAGNGLVAGLIDSFKAEIHMVVRNHGPASAYLPEELEAALSTFGSGCDQFECFDHQAAVHLP